ncbi:tRNA pseudouridine32 synthase / 23S rRNA pseudouridine746 synthase [Marinobacter daqiaonensis]|uniref:tRNA pseudouridine32 synthase / 23S rRNA pseudouridine746 synthase n=1 Tax=Marinobacter daqiaonensis TaxID=650891 RepID=A0A1I6GY36_9GAMM|nr:RNA pseudouridine synthase [Marinobacter daqiaonensis]SFR46981.1 tRNA pseudouridine32 synthase / 23S rRNA pseudouridine746 synthase [Marinobacter daqiaonensis]
MRTTIDLTTDRPQTAVEALSEASDLSRQRIKDAMSKGACWWTHKGKQVRLRRATRELKPGTRIQLYYDDQVLARKPETPEPLADHGRYSAWFKPHGMLSQGSQWGDHCSLLRWVEIANGRPAYLVHRLDADAAGLMLIAHDPKAAGALSQRFTGREMTKVYQARVHGLLDVTDRQVDLPIDGKPALSRVSTLALDREAQCTLLQVSIETGRKHQIRKHLASLNHPIVGDRLYGRAANQPLRLVAVHLAFHCPLTGKAMSLALPDTLNDVGGPSPETSGRPPQPD